MLAAGAFVRMISCRIGGGYRAGEMEADKRGWIDKNLLMYCEDYDKIMKIF